MSMINVFITPPSIYDAFIPLFLTHLNSDKNPEPYY